MSIHGRGGPGRRIPAERNQSRARPARAAAQSRYNNGKSTIGRRSSGPAAPPLRRSDVRVCRRGVRLLCEGLEQMPMPGLTTSAPGQPQDQQRGCGEPCARPAEPTDIAAMLCSRPRLPLCGSHGQDPPRTAWAPPARARAGSSNPECLRWAHNQNAASPRDAPSNNCASRVLCNDRPCNDDLWPRPAPCAHATLEVAGRASRAPNRKGAAVIHPVVLDLQCVHPPQPDGALQQKKEAQVSPGE